MIGTLKGVIEYREDPDLIVDVNGVGYRVLVPLHVLAKITGVGEQIKLYTHTHVREDLLELYGFTDPLDLKVFQFFLSVSGIGCKTALNIFSIGSRQEIIKAIAEGNVAFFTNVPRLGKKNAQKLIIELKNKVGGTEDLDLSGNKDDADEVVSALKSFGFTQAEAQKALKEIKGEGKTVGEKVRLALKYIGK